VTALGWLAYGFGTSGAMLVCAALVARFVRWQESIDDAAPDSRLWRPRF